MPDDETFVMLFSQGGSQRIIRLAPDTFSSTDRCNAI